MLTSIPAKQGIRRPLPVSAVLLAIGLCALVVARGGFCEELNSSGSPAAAGGEAAPLDSLPFPGNAELRARLDAPGKIVVVGERLHVGLLRRFYTAHGYQTVWGDHREQAERLAAVILHAADHGLDPGLFHSVAISARGAALPPVERDLLLSDAFLSYADALARGAMPIEERADDEDLVPEAVDAVAVLDAAMADPDPAKVIGALAPSTPEYQSMQRAYAEYRMIAAAEQSGGKRGSAAKAANAEKRARQLAVNLERLRWLPRHMLADRAVVNAAIAQFQLFRNDRPVFTTRVVVGEQDKQTPEFQSTIDSILFNPPWNIPRSIAQREILPKLAADPGYLTSHHMRYRRNGGIQQEAGPFSALGRLKFEMNDRYDVYLHDTPDKSLFQALARMMSHGCVRVENPRALAALLLGEPEEAIDKRIASGHTARRLLPAAMPIFVVYQTAYVGSDGLIEFRADPYERDEEVWRYLTHAQQFPIVQDSVGSQRKG